MLETSARLLRLLSLLQSRRDWTSNELADRLGVTTRTIRNDVDRLRGLGYPVNARPGVAGGYRLGAGGVLPPLLLDDDEAVAIAVGLRTAAGTSVAGIEDTALRALVKLEQVLPSHLRRRVQAMQAVTAAAPGSGPTVDAEALTVIATATRDRERVRFGYKARDGSESRRLAEPHSLVNLGRRWYLVAWDCDRRAWRTYRMDRVERPRPAGSRFQPRELPAADPAEFVSENLMSAPQRHQARLTLHASADALRERHPSWWGQLEPIDDERCEYRTGDDSLEWLAMRVCMLGVDFEVHEPPELVDALAAIQGRIGRATARTR